MEHIFFPASERGTKDIGWLKSNFSFSFSSYANPTRMGFGLLKAFNDDFVNVEGGFGLHPHTNMEIISVMLNGKMNHKDTIGYSEVVEKDWVQIMSAGSGLRHEEHNVGDEQVNFLQIWIEPKIQNIPPRYQKRFFPEQNRANEIVTIISNEEGQQHCWINQNAKVSIAYFTENQVIEYTFKPKNRSVFIFTISGTIFTNGIEISQRNAIGFWGDANIEIKTTPECRFIIIETPINQ